MESTIDTRLLLQAVKAALRNQRITYRELGRRIGMSESGVKKLFSSEDCSFNRIGQICAAVDLPLPELLAALQHAPAREERFTPEQERFFLKNMDCFRFFWKLVYERVSLDELKSKQRLSEKAAFKYLKQLDELGLVELLPGNQARIPKLELVRWVEPGPLLRKVRKEWASTMIQELLEGKPPEPAHFSLRAYQLTPDSCRDLLRALQELDVEFGRRCLREMSLHKGRLRFVRMVSGVLPGSFVPSLER